MRAAIPKSIFDLCDAVFGQAETFYRVELDGSWCICESKDVADIIGADQCEYTVSEVRMTRRQFNNLPEFEGF